MEKKYYSKEEIKKLKELDVIQHFDTVLDSQFKRGTFTTTDNAVADIYEEATGTKVSRQFSCKSCVFNLYKNAGILYRESEKFYKQEAMRKAREAKNQNKDKDKEVDKE